VALFRIFGPENERQNNLGNHKALALFRSFAIACFWVAHRLCSKDAGLGFNAKDRLIDVEFTAQHEGIVDQIASGEVIGADGNNVELGLYKTWGKDRTNFVDTSARCKNMNGGFAWRK
jgi:hypothetical protein